MSDSANTSLVQLKQIEENAEKMVFQAKKTRDEKIKKKQSESQIKYLEAEKSLKEEAKDEIEKYKEKVSGEGKQLLNSAKKESEQLKQHLASGFDLAVEKGVLIFKKMLGV